MKLSEGKAKEEFQIKEIVLENNVKKHLEELGIYKGSELKIVRFSLGNAGIMVKVLNYELALRIEIAEKIYVQKKV